MTKKHSQPTEATTEGLKDRVQRLPGEATLFDPDTEVYFNPWNGKIENFPAGYDSMPGNIGVIKKDPDNPRIVDRNTKYFDPKIYSYFVKPKYVKMNGEIAEEGKHGFTIHLGFDLDLGCIFGGGFSCNLAISYNSDEKTWTLSTVESVGASEVVGTDIDAGFTIGFTDGNENVLSGWASSGSANTPVGDVTVSGNGENVNVQLKIGPGAGGGYSGGASYSLSQELITVKSFF
ncbi:MAG: hypothetical protein N4A40_14575 [Tissierellales bacterium]|nr:hypothetical protein [Tissierellales bacterium]